MFQCYFLVTTIVYRERLVGEEESYNDVKGTMDINIRES